MCKACCLGKFHKLPFPDSNIVYSEPLQLVYYDIRGPSPLPSTNGSKYYIHFINAYSKYTWLYVLQNKSQALECFIHFKTLIENVTGHKIKTLQTDNG